MVGDLREVVALLEMARTFSSAYEWYDGLQLVQLLRSMDPRSVNIVGMLTDPDFQRLSPGDDLQSAACLARNMHAFLEQRLLFGGVNFDPLFVRFVLCPLAGTICVYVTEFLLAPLSGIATLSQLPSDEEEEEEIIVEERRALLRRKLLSFAPRFAFFVIGSSVALCFKTLFKAMERPPKMVALTCSMIIDTVLIALFDRLLPKSVLALVPSMTKTLLAYEVLVLIWESMICGGTMMPAGSRIMLNLSCGALVSLVAADRTEYEALWTLSKGNRVSVAHGLTFYSVNYLAYLNFRTLLTSIVPSSIPLATVAFASGGLAATTATFVSYPLHTLRTHIALQSEEYRGAWQAYRDICKDGGFPSLYAGISTSLLGIVPSMAASILVFETASLFLGAPRPDKSSFMFDLACGTIASLIASTVTFPIQVVQTRMQMEAAGGRRGSKKKKEISGLGFREVFATIVDKEGVGGLYRGIRPHITKVVVGHVVAFMAYEMVKIPCRLTSFAFRLRPKFEV